MRSWGAADWKNGNQVAGGMEFETAPGALPFFFCEDGDSGKRIAFGPEANDESQRNIIWRKSIPTSIRSNFNTELN